MKSRACKEELEEVEAKKAKEVADKNIVLLVDNSFLNSERNEFKIQTLPHPRTGEKSAFLFGENGGIFEIVKQNKGLQSWFINNTTEEDGSIFITSEVDSLFIILPYLMKQTKFTLIEDVEISEEFPALQAQLGNPALKKRLGNICDMKDVDDEHFYRFNQETTLNWLEKRIEKAQKVIKDRQICTSSGSRASTFVSTDINSNEGDSKLYCLGLMCEYLPDTLSEALFKALGYGWNVKVEDTPQQKRQKTTVTPSDDYSKGFESNTKTKKTKTLTTMQKKLSKGGTTGMKTMDSFFKKPRK